MKIAKQEFDPEISVELLEAHPDNPRHGDDAAVAESVGENGFYGAIIVQKSTGRVLAGHTRLRVAKDAGVKTVPGFWLDVDDKTARRILLADNRTSDLAVYDDEFLMSVLAMTLEESGSLTGTGYDDNLYSMLLMQEEASDGEVVGNFREGPSRMDRQDSWEAADIRTLILPFALEEYEGILDGLGTLRGKLGLESNADVVAHLIREAVGVA
jgi:hypothetical protein